MGAGVPTHRAREALAKPRLPQSKHTSLVMTAVAVASTNDQIIDTLRAATDQALSLAVQAYHDTVATDGAMALLEDESGARAELPASKAQTDASTDSAGQSDGYPT